MAEHRPTRSASPLVDTVLVSVRGLGRTWSWAATEDEIRERREHVAQLVGQRLASVRYYTIDYEREDVAPDLIDRGPRLVEDDAEWAAPTWRFDGFDALDFGIELETESGELWSLTWDPPGIHEGIGIRSGGMLGSGVRDDADVAIWEVTSRPSPWEDFSSGEVCEVSLHYFPWDTKRSGFWCPHITLHSTASCTDIVMGDSDRQGGMFPSADNVAVLRGMPLPSWVPSDG